MELGLPFLVSASGVAVAAIAFYNRDKPEWQRDIQRIYILAFGQVALGAMTWLLLSR
jgi:hypothetical protein